MPAELDRTDEVLQRDLVKRSIMSLDSELNGKHSVYRKYEKIRKKTRNLLDSKSINLPKDIPNSENQWTLYATVIKSLWIFGIRLWGCTDKSDTLVVQPCQSKTLSYGQKSQSIDIREKWRHAPGTRSTVAVEINEFTQKYGTRLERRSNLSATAVAEKHTKRIRRLERHKPYDLV